MSLKFILGVLIFLFTAVSSLGQQKEIIVKKAGTADAPKSSNPVIANTASLNPQENEEETDIKTIEIDYLAFKEESIFVTGGKRKVKIKNLPRGAALSIEIKVLGKNYRSLSLGDSASARTYKENEKFDYVFEEPFDFDRFTKFRIKISSSQDKKLNRTYTLTSEAGKNWFTTFGLNAIFLTNSNTYKTIEMEEQFQIVQDGGQQIHETLPSIMFTFMKADSGSALGVTGGLGFNLERVSLFLGGSLGIGQNLVITAGVSYHQQQRLDSKYQNGDLVEANLNFDDLHSEYYRFNPFVGLSFWLDSNPFK